MYFICTESLYKLYSSDTPCIELVESITYIGFQKSHFSEELG